MSKPELAEWDFECHGIMAVEGLEKFLLYHLPSINLPSHLYTFGCWFSIS